MGGRPFLAFICERVLFHLPSVATDGEADDDYVPNRRTRSQSKRKQRASRLFSTGSVRSARRVRLADVISGSVSRPPPLFDSSGDNHVPPMISASHTLEGRYSVFFLVSYGGCTGVVCFWVSFSHSFCIPYVAFIVVVDTETGPRVHSSEDSDVFVCEDAVDTPAVESGVSSVLPAEASRHSRTQHGRMAVGVEASVVYNDWDNGTLVFICFVLYVITLGFIFICSLIVEFLYSVLLVPRTCLLSAGLESVPPMSPMVMSAAQCVMLARSAAQAERTETQKETKTLSKRKCLPWVTFCSSGCCNCFPVLSSFVCWMVVWLIWCSSCCFVLSVGCV